MDYKARTCVALIELLISTFLLVGTEVLAALRIGPLHSGNLCLLLKVFGPPNSLGQKVALIELLLTYLLVGTTVFGPSPGSIWKVLWTQDNYSDTRYLSA